MDNPLSTQDKKKPQQCAVFFHYFVCLRPVSCVPSGLSIIAFSFSFLQHLFLNSLQLEFDMKCVLQLL